MTDPRPANCRFRLQDEGKPYPRSSCQNCGVTIKTPGLRCPYASDASVPSPAPKLSPEQIRERAEFLRQQDDQINAKAIGEGWGRAAFDMGVEPKDLEPRARQALLHAREDIVALHKALLTAAAKIDDGLEVLPPMQLAAVVRIVRKYRL